MSLDRPPPAIARLPNEVVYMIANELPSFAALIPLASVDKASRQRIMPLVLLHTVCKCRWEELGSASALFREAVRHLLIAAPPPDRFRFQGLPALPSLYSIRLGGIIATRFPPLLRTLIARCPELNLVVTSFGVDWFLKGPKGKRIALWPRSPYDQQRDGKLDISRPRTLIACLKASSTTLTGPATPSILASASSFTFIRRLCIVLHNDFFSSNRVVPWDHTGAQLQDRHKLEGCPFHGLSVALSALKHVTELCLDIPSDFLADSLCSAGFAGHFSRKRFKHLEVLRIPATPEVWQAAKATMFSTDGDPVGWFARSSVGYFPPDDVVRDSLPELRELVLTASRGRITELSEALRKAADPTPGLVQWANRIFDRLPQLPKIVVMEEEDTPRSGGEWWTGERLAAQLTFKSPRFFTECRPRLTWKTQEDDGDDCDDGDDGDEDSDAIKTRAN